MRDVELYEKRELLSIPCHALVVARAEAPKQRTNFENEECIWM